MILIIYFIKKHLVIIGIGLVILIGLFFVRNHELNPPQEEQNEQLNEMIPTIIESPDTSEEVERWLVDIKGEVENPGVYEIENTARVNDVIALAGGFTKDADVSIINLAQKVHDEMVIIVPKEGDEQTIALVPFQAPSSYDKQTVQINQATKEEIETLPGIGPSKAQAIIDYREENGAFQQVDDLLQVNGIGVKTLDNLREYISIP